MKILKNRSERDSEYEILFFPPFEANEFGNNSQINHFQPYNNYTCHCLKKKKNDNLNKRESQILSA